MKDKDNNYPLYCGHPGPHYHCPGCGQLSGMYGCVTGKPPVRKCTGEELPDEHGNRMSISHANVIHTSHKFANSKDFRDSIVR